VAQKREAQSLSGFFTQKEGKKATGIQRPSFTTKHSARFK
jgi:hypothetical protein